MVEDALDRAMRRLEAALGALEQRWSDGLAPSEPDLFAATPDRRTSDLEAEIDALRQRERALEDVAAEASAALGRAAAEVRAALAAEA